MTPPTTPIALNAYDDSAGLARALAAHVAEALRRRIAQNGTASLAVSGGRTPVSFFEVLAGAPIDWSRVAVTLVDERWVPETSDRSNAALVRRHLLKGPAAAARFLPLYTGAPTPEEGIAEAAGRVASLPSPFAAVVLGMGDDGHTASFFPGAQTLAAAIDPTTPEALVAVRADAAGEPRITFTLPRLVSADTLVLHIEGMTKRAVLERACAGGPVDELPVRSVLRARAPLDVMWCP